MTRTARQITYYPAPDRGMWYCFRSISLYCKCIFVCLFVCFFISFFLCLLARLRENGWTDLHEIFREGVEWPWDDVIQFSVNSDKPRDAAMRNTGTGFVVLYHHSLFISLFISLFACLFIYSFVSKITRKRPDQFAWNFQGRCRVTFDSCIGRPDSILGQFGHFVRLVKGQFVVTGHSYSVWLLFSGSPVLPCSDWECNEIAVFGLLLHRNTGRGSLCFAPQLDSIRF